MRLAGKADIPVREHVLKRDDLGHVSELFLTGTTSEVLSTVRVDDHPRRLVEAVGGQAAKVAREGGGAPSRHLRTRQMFEFTFGVILFVLFLGFWFWHSPIRRKLTREEINRYLAAAEKLSLPE